MVGVALLAFSVAFLASAVFPARRQVAALVGELEQGTERRRLHGTAPLQAAPEADLREVVRLMAAPEQVVGRVMGIAQAAEHHHMTLESGDYRLGRDRETGISSYQIDLPVHGDYPRLRRFLGEALAAVPGLALEELSVKREHLFDPEVAGRARFTLYVAEGAGARAPLPAPDVSAAPAPLPAVRSAPARGR